MLVELQHLHSLVKLLSNEVSTLRTANVTLQHQVDQLTTEHSPELALKQALSASQESHLAQQDALNTLTMRHNTLVLEHDTLSVDFARLTTELSRVTAERLQLAQQCEDLAQKNKYAKQKVASIMQRLSALNAQESSSPSL